ncbi:sulfotransferase family protein [Aliiruegeria haliotis]|uniref:Sulfotransferase family protein n=1 Tax=Aliiruegeria haliotis TaxID=1280846 RepID=A0A2T0RKT7_9RHOB|nr:sulfotransferase family 2 domain-containing protein [Aliiruegeria haliotis]PRY21804.1 sulfotransferase family protein [Aliiruegeria haliotis]
MPIARVNGHLFFFVHVPKCGGTSIKRFLDTHGVTAFDGHGATTWSKCTVDHIHADLHTRFVPDRFFDHGFIVFRDPVERLVSSYGMYAGPPGRSLNPANHLLRTWAHVRGRKARSYPFMGREWAIDFDTWVRGVFWIQKRWPYKGNNHFRPQSEFFRAGLRVFFLEDGLDKICRWIGNQAGLGPEIEVPHTNRARTSDVQMTHATRRLIEKHYRADYDLFATLRAEQDGGPALAKDQARAAIVPGGGVGAVKADPKTAG